MSIALGVGRDRRVNGLAAARLITGLERGTSTAAGQIERHHRSVGSPVQCRRILTQPPQANARAGHISSVQAQAVREG